MLILNTYSQRIERRNIWFGKEEEPTMRLRHLNIFSKVLRTERMSWPLGWRNIRAHLEEDKYGMWYTRICAVGSGMCLLGLGFLLLYCNVMGYCNGFGNWKIGEGSVWSWGLGFVELSRLEYIALVCLGVGQLVAVGVIGNGIG